MSGEGEGHIFHSDYVWNIKKRRRLFLTDVISLPPFFHGSSNRRGETDVTLVSLFCCCVQHMERGQATHHHLEKQKKRKEEKEGERKGENHWGLPPPRENTTLVFGIRMSRDPEGAEQKRLFVCVSFNRRNTQHQVEALCCLFSLGREGKVYGMEKRRVIRCFPSSSRAGPSMSVVGACGEGMGPFILFWSMNALDR